MIKISYDQLESEANKLIQKMILASDSQVISYWWNEYVSLLDAAGWSVLEFDNETLKRIDASWDDSVKKEDMVRDVKAQN